MRGTHSLEVGTSRLLLPELGEHLGHLVWRAHARVTVALGARLPAGVDLHAYAALLTLAGGATRSQQSVADAICVSRTTMVRVAGELAAQGLVRRDRKPEDRRSYALTRTRAGAAAARRWRRHVEDLEDSLTAAFTPVEREELHTLLLRVAEPELAPDTPAPLRGSICFLITRVQYRLHRDVTVALAPLDLEPRHVGALLALVAMGPVPQAELARRLGVSGASVVRIVDDLQRRGLVERRRLASDLRTQVLHLADRATGVVERARGISGERLRSLDPADTARLTELLRRFVTAP